MFINCIIYNLNVKQHNSGKRDYLRTVNPNSFVIHPSETKCRRSDPRIKREVGIASLIVAIFQIQRCRNAVKRNDDHSCRKLKRHPPGQLGQRPKRIGPARRAHAQLLQTAIQHHSDRVWPSGHVWYSEGISRWQNSAAYIGHHWFRCAKRELQGSSWKRAAEANWCRGRFRIIYHAQGWQVVNVQWFKICLCHAHQCKVYLFTHKFKLININWWCKNNININLT